MKKVPRLGLEAFEEGTMIETWSVWGTRAANLLETAEQLQRDLASWSLLKMKLTSSSERRSK